MSVSTNIHDVANTCVSDVKMLQGMNSYFREIVMRDKKGNIVAEFNVFSENPDALVFMISRDPKIHTGA